MTMAVGKGMPSACRYLGFAYMEGKGTARNKNLAKKWFTKGSLEGDTLSMIGLAECLSKREERIEREPLGFFWQRTWGNPDRFGGWSKAWQA